MFFAVSWQSDVAAAATVAVESDGDGKKWQFFMNEKTRMLILRRSKIKNCKVCVAYVSEPQQSSPFLQVLNFIIVYLFPTSLHFISSLQQLFYSIFSHLFSNW